MRLNPVLQFATACWLFAISCSAISADTAKHKVILAYQLNESYPYQMGTGSDMAKPPGIAIDILIAAANQLDIALEFQRYPNKRVQIMLRDGEVDGAFMFSFKEDRLEMGLYPRENGRIDPSKRITTLSYSLYVKDGSKVQWDGQVFSNLEGTVIAGAGNSIVDFLLKGGVSVTEVPTVQSSILMMQADRASAIAEQGAVIDSLILSGGFTNIKKLPIPLASKDYYLMLSKQFVGENPQLALDFWQAIADVRDSVFAEVVHQYMPEN